MRLARGWVGLAVQLLLAGACGRVGYDARVASSDGNDAGSAWPRPPDGIYRSVGPGNTSALATGDGNPLRVTGSTATFSVALPATVGVGDALQYDSDGDGVVDALAFIHARLSASEYVVAAEDGGPPPDTAAPGSFWGLFRPYTSLADAAVGSTNPSIAIPFDTWASANDLVARGKSWHIACYADATDFTIARFVGWATSPTAYLRIFTPVDPWEVGVTQRHSGVWDASRYHIETPEGGNDRAILVVDAFARIEGLQIFVNTDAVTGDLPYGISFDEYTASRTAWAGHNIVRGNEVPAIDSSIGRGIKLHATERGPTLYAWNNVIYDLGEPCRGIELTGAGTTAYLYNNTIATSSPAVLGNSTEDLFMMRNNVAIQCGTRCLGGTSAYSGSNNRTSDDSAPAHGIGAQLSTEVLTDYFASASDFHIGAAAPRRGELVDVGADLSSDASLAFDRDIDGEVRAAPWDVGADEL